MKSVEIVHIDLNRVRGETVFDFLELFGFTRYCHEHWLDPARSKDPRYPEDHVSESPEGPYPAVIVPYTYLGKSLFIIDEEMFEEIREYLRKSLGQTGLADEGENMDTKNAPRNTVYVGSKPVMNYCLAVMSCLQQGSDTVVLKARGRAISTAVDVAEVTRNRFLEGLKISGIEIGTEQLESSEGQSGVRNVSTIEITLKKG